MSEEITERADRESPDRGSNRLNSTKRDVGTRLIPMTNGATVRKPQTSPKRNAKMKSAWRRSSTRIADSPPSTIQSLQTCFGDGFFRDPEKECLE
jgi:uncharacterized protein RhaS with RHS repeats